MMASTQRQTVLDFAVRKSSRTRSKPEPFQLCTDECWTPKKSAKDVLSQTPKSRSSKRRREPGINQSIDLFLHNYFLLPNGGKCNFKYCSLFVSINVTC